MKNQDYENLEKNALLYKLPMFEVFAVIFPSDDLKNKSPHGLYLRATRNQGAGGDCVPPGI